MTAPPRRGQAGQAGYRMRGQQGRVIESLGEAIVSGRFAPGTLLPREFELMSEQEVSRTSIREAMKVLAAKGLVEIRQKTGTRVRPLDLWNLFDADVLRWHLSQGRGESILRDLIELRQVIEPAAARMAAGRANFDDLLRIDQAVRSMREGVRDLDAYLHADVAFHMAVFGASHNVLFARLSHLVADFLEISFHLQQQALNEEDNRIQDDIDGHQLVFEAIRRGDGNAAAERMLEVVLNGKSSLYHAFGSR
jgi:GntR family transcriptional regulator, galactonate operon transcriptional repressor